MNQNGPLPHRNVAQEHIVDEKFLNDRRHGKPVVWNEAYRKRNTPPLETVFHLYYNVSDFLLVLLLLPHPSPLVPGVAHDKLLVRRCECHKLIPSHPIPSHPIPPHPIFPPHTIPICRPCSCSSA
jgi:hypothetical protein